MKASPISVAMLVVSLLLAPALLPQSPDSANQNAASPAPSASAAEVPRLIKFSGTLLDAQDRPLAGPVGVTFALHAQQTGGAALWLETQNVKPDASGVYTVLLGANSANGVPAELFASGEARWLEVQAERQAEQPRVLLVSVPYALKAKDAETLGGKPASAFVTTETLSGAGTSAGASAAAPSSSTTSAALPSSKGQTTPKKATSTPPPATACTSVTSDGTATANSISLFTTACNVESSVITQLGSNVGIGTAAPAVALDVLGNNAGLRLSGTGTHQVTVTGATSGRLGQDSSGFFFASDTNGKTVRFLTNNGTLNEWMRITSAGNVGIGTQTPTQKLEVTANSTSTGTEAVRGEVVAQNSGSFNTVGVHGLTNSGGGRGVVGEATSGTTTAIGVQGLTSSDAGIGVSGIASAGGSTVGVQGEATAGPVSGNTIGVRGVSASNFGTGVQGEATSTSGFGVGVHGLLFGTTGAAGLFSAGPGATLILGQSGGLNMFSVGSNGDVSLAGNLSLPATTNASTGVIMLGNQPFAHSFGGNTFVGQGAGNFSMTGGANTAIGASALVNNSGGHNNTASGASALGANTTGASNSAFGSGALFVNTTGSLNAAFGASALALNTTGGNNSAFGVNALTSNTTGNNNTAMGTSALASLTMLNSYNSAFGFQALQGSTGGARNSAFGANALPANTMGLGNAAFGFDALNGLTSGSENVAIGDFAGVNLGTGSSNIYIGSFGPAGIGSESSTIRIGVVGTQTATFISGINGATSASGVAVFVNSSGQLGTMTSSRRFKEEIADVGGESDLLMKLRPVSFYYKPELDPTHTRQYGLVAEEVAQVSPELVVFDKDGVPETVRYHFVNAMLLNEVQKQRKANEEQQSTIARQQAQIQDLAARLAKLEALVAPIP